MAETFSTIAPILAAGVSGFSSLLGTSHSNRQANKAAHQQFLNQVYLQQMNQEYLREMSNTAHQREVQDLIKAGINPLYTATGGNGASTPQGGAGSAAMAQAQKYEFAEIASNIYNATRDSLTNRAAQKSQKELNDAEIQVKGAQAANIAEDTINKEKMHTLMDLDYLIKSAENTIKSVEASYADKKWAKSIQEMGTKIKLMNAQTATERTMQRLNEIRRQTEFEQQAKLRAETKYTNERARGYTESWSDDYETGSNIFGMGGKGRTSKSYSSTR